MFVALAATVSPTKLKQFNACRLYLKVLRLSDITTADGLTIQPAAWTGNGTLDSFSNWLWPRQTRPPDTCWATWKTLLRKIFLRSKHGRITDFHLSNPLGMWTKTSYYDRTWNYYHDISSDTLLEYNLDEYLSHFRVHTGAQRRTFHFELAHDDTVQQLPQSASPASVITRNDTSMQALIFKPSPLQRNIPQTAPTTPEWNHHYKRRITQIP
jgi:hypothetical protein